MSDKLIFFLMIIVLVSGVYTYDQYKIGQGEPSPVGQLIDYAGLSKYIDMYEKQKTVEKETEYFHFNSRESLEKLLTMQTQLSEKRNALISKRSAIIEKIHALNNQTMNDTNAYITLLDKEKARILKALPQIREYGKGLANSYQGQDELSKERYLKALKEGVLMVFRDVTDDPEKNIPFVMKTLEGVEKLVHQEEGVIEDYCKDIRSENLEDSVVISRCIKKRVMDLQKDINMYAKVVKDPANGFNKVKEFTGILDYEAQLLKNNSDATEARLLKGSEDVEAGLRYLVQELVEITDQEIHAFMRMYSAFHKEQEALLNNLASNHRRFISAQKMNHPRIRRILEDLNENSRFNFSGVLQNYNEGEKEREALMQQFMANERDLFISTNQRRKGNREYVNNLIKKYESVKQREVSVGGPTSDGKYSLTDGSINHYGESEKTNAAQELMQKRKKERETQQIQSQQTNQKMDNLRTKARNDGFYN